MGESDLDPAVHAEKLKRQRHDISRAFTRIESLEDSNQEKLLHDQRKEMEIGATMQNLQKAVEGLTVQVLGAVKAMKTVTTIEGRLDNIDQRLEHIENSRFNLAKPLRWLGTTKMGYGFLIIITLMLFVTLAPEESATQFIRVINAVKGYVKP